jgi:crotonobetainyl-CoA:carnitine CoA-transferase CaiB-like acyl-CoA transferase
VSFDRDVMVTAGDSPGPLDGVRVVELGVWVAGPAAGGIMADWGADVIKIEPESGDPQRRVFAAVGVRDDLPVPPFEVDNRGKRSVVMKLRDPDELERLHALIATADVVLSNMRPGALERLGLDHETVCSRHPSIVYGLVTGYGLDGDERDRAGYDVGAYWARSGLAHTLVPPGELPPNLRSGMGDHQTGMTMAAGIMAKLFERSRTGRGGLVTTSLLRVGMYSIAWELGIQLRFGKRQPTAARDEAPAPLVNCYLAGDGRAFWLICLEGDRHWPNVLASIGRPELDDDERFDSARGRARNAAALIAEFDATFAEHSFDHWAKAFDEHDVWWAPIQSIADVVDDPQAQPGFVDMSPRAGEAPHRAVASPVDFDGFTMRPGPVPRLGEHTDDVLSDLG